MGEKGRFILTLYSIANFITFHYNFMQLSTIVCNLKLLCKFFVTLGKPIPTYRSKFGGALK